ncbi:MAG: saccharopine dehydrogenase NADP-binding domain-containing protein [Deltaproteobacteria bacterium]|nr:saccharopine dehydrogenase NADP-binding domain-containing protein [Deltaproteobacteria bacterium]
MNIVLLGGLGLQGKAALLDLTRSTSVEKIICGDTRTELPEQMRSHLDLDKIDFVQIDASSKNSILEILRRDVDAAIDLLPAPLMLNAFDAALEAGVSIVSTNYFHRGASIDEQAKAAGISIMPECGLDPGIDLILFGHAIKKFDTLQVLNSYCGGFPEKKARNNPLKYKVSWNWDMVLTTQKRESTFIKNGQQVTIPAEKQHDNEFIHQIFFPGLGNLEAIPNGDAAFYIDLLNVRDSIMETGRYSLRWPGWCAFWQPLKELGFLGDDPLAGLDSNITPHQFLTTLIGPQIQYSDDEKDIVAMYNVFKGLKDGRKKWLTSSIMIERDLDTGLFAMSIGVGYTASIVAQMLGSGQIQRKGVLSPALDVPYETFMAELSERGILVKEETGFGEA